MKYLIFTLSLLALIGCKDNTQQENKTTAIEESVNAATEQNINEVSVYSNTWTEEIKMNNGAKWQANAETNEGVKNMQNSIKIQKTSTLKEYQKLAEQLNKDISYVIKKCSMKGDSHNNLHVWLLPLMEKIEALSEAKTVEEASKLKHSIEENINGYNTYFQ
ncbi:hypothetical protein IMCC3317_23030 [Kordia antarctica]|uniref:Lipoprotein n=1 Tax=Kordia antarctica TaxID=1218801 RepID=A0A7L4ZJP2_9FLAO|nr:hypothetical protein [Kordia antarctica]QHI36933.1 hypothetical protein IMCC3317_23030 [Kordia antarctica]